jgi:hypothetical protein
LAPPILTGKDLIAAGAYDLYLRLPIRVGIASEYARVEEVDDSGADWTRRLHHPEVVEEIARLAVG